MRLLEKENEQFRRDCDNKIAYQKKQEDRLREENERLRIKVNDMGRPKVSVLAELEERQSQLNQQIDVYHAKIDMDERRMFDLDKVLSPWLPPPPFAPPPPSPFPKTPIPCPRLAPTANMECSPLPFVAGEPAD